MIRNKYIILPFLLLAWTIIFAHSIIPHHHYSENHHSECNHNHAQNVNLEENAEIQDCDHDSNDNICHFHVEVLTKISVDNVFITNKENTFLNNFDFSESYDNIFFVDFISDQLPKTDHLRGPPIKS